MHIYIYIYNPPGSLKTVIVFSCTALHQPTFDPQVQYIDLNLTESCQRLVTPISQSARNTPLCMLHETAPTRPEYSTLTHQDV